MVFSSPSHCRLISNRFHRAVTIKPLLNPFRSINYDERDPFLCNACGFCKYAKFDYTLTARPCCAVDPIENEEDRKKVDFEKNTEIITMQLKKKKKPLLEERRSPFISVIHFYITRVHDRQGLPLLVRKRLI